MGSSVLQLKKKGKRLQAKLNLILRNFVLNFCKIFYLRLVNKSVVPGLSQILCHLLHVIQDANLILKNGDARRYVNDNFVFR